MYRFGSRPSFSPPSDVAASGRTRRDSGGGGSRRPPKRPRTEAERPPPPYPAQEEPAAPPIERDRARIVFDGGDMLVAHKPAGLASHASAECKVSLVEVVADLLKRSQRASTPSEAAPSGAPPWPVHRLDRSTGGLVMLAQSAEARATWGQRVANGEVARYYVALVEGELPEDGVIDDDLWIKRQGAAPRLVSAITHFHRLAQGEHAALVAVALDTGRFHQIRRHFSGRGHPLVGDGQHGGMSAPRPLPPDTLGLAAPFLAVHPQLAEADGVPPWFELGRLPPLFARLVVLALPEADLAAVYDEARAFARTQAQKASQQG